MDKHVKKNTLHLSNYIHDNKLIDLMAITGTSDGDINCFTNSQLTILLRY